MAAIGYADYRNGARERLAEALILFRQDRFGGCVYVGGRAVEGMLRAVVWKHDSDYASGKKTLETGHNLRDILRLVRNLGVLRHFPVRDALSSDVQKVGRLWWNNMRFLATTRIMARWYDLGEFGGKRTIKQATQEYCDACATVIRRCEALCQS